MSGTPKTRQIALELVLRAAASIKGWEIKTGYELLGEAELVEVWLKTGKRAAPAKGKK